MLPRLPLVALLLLASALSCAVARAAVPPAAADPEAGLPLFDSFSPRDYRGHSQVWNAVEDAAGLLYFGNLNQVIVYDGARWSRLPVPGATFVRGLAIDADDTLWLGGVDELGYAQTDATGARHFVSLKEKLPAEARAFGDIWRIAVTPSGILLQSAAWLLRWDPRRQSFVTFRLPPNSRWTLACVGGEIWLSSIREDWFRVRDEGSALHLDPLPVPPGLTGSRALHAVAASNPGEYLIATDKHGLWRWDGRTYTAFPTAIDADLRSAAVYAMCGLPDGRLVITSLLGGVWIIDSSGRLLAHFNDKHGLPDNTALSAFPTRDGTSVWVGLARGAIRLDVRPWLTWFHPGNGASVAKMFAPARLRGELFVPSSGDGLYRLNRATAGSPATLSRDPAITALVNSVTPVGDALVLGTATGLLEWHGRGQPVAFAASPANSSAFIPLSQRPGTWAALNHDTVRLYRRDPAGTWRTAGPIPGLERVRSLVEDHDGSWWSGRPVGGVLHTTFPPGSTAPVVTALTAPASLPAAHGWTRFTRDHVGPLLACNTGLLRYDATARRFTPTSAYGSALADGSTAVFGLTPDDRDGLWLILRDPENPAADTLVTPRLAFGRAGQLTALHLPRLALLDDAGHLLHEPASAHSPETVWLAAQGALLRIRVDLWRGAPASPPPRLHLRSLTTAAGRRLPLTGGWQLPDSDRSLHVHVAAPAFAGDATAVYETTLLTSSGREVRADTSPERHFTALGAGAYSLTTRARTLGGLWSEPVSIAFTVLPPWWRSPRALAIYAAAFLLALAAAWRTRTRRYLRRQYELEAAVAARTSELAAQNAELVRLRQIEFDEKLAARLAEHKARLEVLRYQLNPHFLFNTLNAVCAQIIAAPRTARDTVIRLAEFCRITLHRPGGAEGEPTLGEEVAMLRAYLDIEQTRLGDLLDYTIDCDPSLHALRLPPFLLLPLVENAVKYGSATSKDRVSIRLAFRRGADGGVLIEVANSGVWIAPDTTERPVPSLGIGLENLRQRLARYFPGKHEFTTEPTDGWVVVRLRLHPS
jgi:ligand-binding sensor domain-containing protein